MATETPSPDDDRLVRAEIGDPAHGGHCVARVDGRVVFVRHTLPGEEVLVRITDRRSRFWRGEAVDVLRASPDRVEHVWPEAGPGGVGGAELGHAALPAQRRWKAHVLGDVLRRIGGEQVAQDVAAARGGAAALTAVAALPGDDATRGLGTRTRVSLTVDADGRAGMHRHRSATVVPLRAMPLAVADTWDLGLFGDGSPWRRTWRPGSRVEVVAPSVGDPLVLVDGQAMRRKGPVDRRTVRERVELGDGARAAGLPAHLDYRVEAAGFWQVHRGAPRALVEALLGVTLGAGVLGPGARVVELYSGAGLLTVPLAAVTGPTGAVVSLEQAPGAVRDARRNLHAHPWAQLREADVTVGSVRHALRDAAETGGARGGVATAAPGTSGGPDLVVLDPPRSGAGEKVLTEICAGSPGAVALVACDPAALARDLAAARAAGYVVREVVALDLFPHTHHLEVVALLQPA